MRYVSTRGAAPPLDFAEVTLAGLARDGGLYVPETWPRLAADDLAALAGLPFAEVAVRVMTPFLGDTVEGDAFAAMVDDAYSGFDHAAVAPLRQIAAGEWLVELFHSPTLAFKDFALQLLGRLFDHLLRARGARVTIVGATSGDTGSAAIEAGRDRDAMTVFILHPEGRVSEVQRRQMTTVPSANVHNIAIEGTFDDCQALVKGCFNDATFRDELHLSAVNSINWARVMAQIVYYVYAAVALGSPARAVAFAVPTGNFGDVYAGYATHAMGLPIERLVVATNRNDILDRFFRSGAYEVAEVHPTMSPSMDIQVASNFERLLFDLVDRDGSQVAAHMTALAETGAFRVGDEERARAAQVFVSGRVDEDETLATIAAVRRETGILIDPHTAVAIQAGRACRGASAIPLLVLATAHPAKFPDAVEAATGVRPALPPRLADLLEREERYEVLPNDLATLQAHIRARA
jgi:threonine synthase